MAMGERKKETIYSKKQIEELILGSSKTRISDVSIHKRINKMIASGELYRIGSGQYAFEKKAKLDYSLGYEASMQALDKLKGRFGKGARFIVYESTLLNLFLNHLITRPTVIVEAERDLAETAFWLLKEEGFKSVLLNPSEEENYRYNPYDGSGIIVKAMVSKAPIDGKRHRTTIEKLLVDIVCDKTLGMFYEGAEVPCMVEYILQDYAVRLDSVRNYAKRRHCLDKLIECVPQEWKGAFPD